MKNSKWNSPALKRMRDVAWGPGAQSFLRGILHRSQPTAQRVEAIDAANAKRRRRAERNVRRLRGEQHEAT